jgi:hypothetical protein
LATTDKNFKVKNGLDVGGNAAITGDANVAGKLSVTARSGDEGGEIFLANAVTNTTIPNGVTIDVYQNKLRFFEQGGDARGYYIDITGGGNAASTNLVGGGSASDSFRTISANGTSVVADSSTDTLTITPGDGLSIVGNATSDTITFTPNIAGASANGIVTTGSQTFAGEKTFSNNMIASANITANSGYVSADTFRIDTTYTGGSSQAGEISWDPDEGTVMFQLGSGAVTHRIGQQLDIRVRNNTGSTIPEGAVVYINGSSGQEPTISLANAATEGASAQTIGVVTHQGGIATGANGYVCIAGVMRGVDVGAYTAGTPLWLSATAGQFTDTKPTAPINGVFIGWVVKEGNAGSILISIQNGYEIDELHNVSITDITADEILQRSANNTVWINRTFAEANIANLAAATNTFTGNVNATTFNGNVSATTVTANSLYATSNIIANTSVSNATIKLNAGYLSTAAVIEMGDTSGVSSTPAIVFHSGTDGTNAFDSSISAFGGTTTDGQGNLALSAALITLGNVTANNSTVNVAGNLSVFGTSNATTFNGSGAGLTNLDAAQINSNTVPTLNSTNLTSNIIRLNSTDEVTNVSTTHAFQIGPDAGANLRLDVNEVHAINNGSYTTLLLNEAGGNVNIASASAIVSVPGTINANIINATNINFTSASLATSGTIDLNFATDAYKTMANITGTTTFTASNYGIGRTVTVRIINGSTTTARTINFPAGWVFVGPEPTTIAASKTGILTITSFGTTEADCVAAWAVQV